jgi:hypothetical protein
MSTNYDSTQAWGNGNSFEDFPSLIVFYKSGLRLNVTRYCGDDIRGYQTILLADSTRREIEAAVGVRLCLSPPRLHNS